eukprot:gene14376-biopygen15662
MTPDGIEPPLSDLESEVLPLHHGASLPPKGAHETGLSPNRPLMQGCPYRVLLFPGRGRGVLTEYYFLQAQFREAGAPPRCHHRQMWCASRDAVATHIRMDRMCRQGKAQGEKEDTSGMRPFSLLFLLSRGTCPGRVRCTGS